MIESAKNQVIKTIQQLKTTRGRKKSNLYYLEGIKIIEEALISNQKLIKILFSQRVFETAIGKQLMDKLEARGIQQLEVTEGVMKDLCDTETNQGIVAIVEKKIQLEGPMKIQEKNNRILILDQIQDPGNLGTLIRTADALGYGQIFCSKGTADLYNPKVLRSTMGSIFHVDISYYESHEALIEALHQQGFYILATTPEPVTDIREVEAEKIALIIGNEGNGVSEELFQRCDLKVTIRMKGRAESLNAAMAAGICMYALN